MKVNALEMQNFKGFERKQIKFAPSVTLIVGENGQGKSSVLDATAVGLGAFLSGLPGVRSRHFRKHDSLYEQRSEMSSPILSAARFTAVTIAGEIGGEHARWTRSQGDSPREISAAGGNAAANFAKRLDVGVQHGHDMLLPLIAYHDTSRLFRPGKRGAEVRADTPNPRYRGYWRALETESVQRRVLKGIGRSLVARRSRGPNSFDEPGEIAMRAVLDSIPQITDIHMGDADEDPIVLEQGHWRPFEALSDGYRNLFLLVGDLALRASQLNPQLGRSACAETPGVVLIDEIDLHMHPRWQGSILAELQQVFPKIQFIGTTHSPFVIQSVDGLPGARVENLDREGVQPYNMSLEDVAEDIQGVKQPQRSRRYREMERVATQYYELLERGRGAPPETVAQVKVELDRLAAPYSQNPAYHAFLELRRQAMGLADEEL